MANTIEKNTEWESSQQEMRRLILWIKDNPDKWYLLCNPGSYNPSREYIAELIKSLHENKLYTAILFVIYSNTSIVEIERAIRKTTYECFLDIPIETLAERFIKNMGDDKTTAQVEQPEE